MPFTVAIVGRPNVGKSTLFNRLVGRRLAIVDDTPGVTRDLREGEARLGDLRFRVLDTAGVEQAPPGTLTARMRELTERAIADADLCLFLIDAREGLTAADEDIAAMLRRRGARVIVCANKAEGSAGEAGALEAHALGLGEVVPISAAHGEGLEELRDAIAEAVAAAGTVNAAGAAARPRDDAAPAGAGGEIARGAAGKAEEPEEPEEEDGLGEVDAAEEADPLAERRPLRIAVVGRPNAGKSTLVNAILGEERLLTGPEAGITRDAIAVSCTWGGRALEIFDTAGLRKRARVQEKLEKLSVADALRAVRFAEVVVVVIDATRPFESQDLRIADLAAREGRAVVIAINKWDLVENRQKTLRELREACERLLPQLRGVPLVPVSAVTGAGLDRLRDAIFEAHRIWNTRVSTAELNRWLQHATATHPPPAVSGRRVRLRYATQVKARPPTFLIWCSRPEALPESYLRYLVNGLRDAFGLAGVPIRLELRKGENPYAGRLRRGRRRG